MCVTPIFRDRARFSGKLAFTNPLLNERDPSIVDWMQIIENTFEIPVENNEWVITNFKKNILHLAILLVRQTIEVRWGNTKQGKKTATNPLTLRPQVEDPLTKFLYLTDERKFENSFSHGLWSMARTMKEKNLPFEAVTLTQAIKDLKKTEFGINDAWSAFNVRIGTGI